MKKASTKFYKNVYRGYWNNKWYDSSWELALIVYYHDHNMELTRNTQKFPYTFRKRTYYYQPDFILEDGSYLEVKGINDLRSKRKVASFHFPIKLMTHKDMKQYLDYMTKTYGKEWREKFHGQNNENI